ncbi:MAG: OmpA family protein, partial [Proteobacteria bacterium]|nr:OmpA family protein [Pseudomonadota bacterium]
AAKVHELSRYRSEFFGRLRDVLGAQPGVRIVGDRFVFQSEVLFAKGLADLGDAGKNQLLQLARTLRQISTKIPADIDWVLRVDGHTDNDPIKTSRFPSNWELSAARAISVVQFLIEQGLPPNRFAATGFGEFQPLDNRTDEIAKRRNRRIELKFTQR